MQATVDVDSHSLQKKMEKSITKVCRDKRHNSLVTLRLIAGNVGCVNIRRVLHKKSEHIPNQR